MFVYIPAFFTSIFKENSMIHRNLPTPMVILALALGFALACAFPAMAGSAYNYKPPVRSTKLPRTTPESKNINSLYILNLLDDLERRGTEVHSVIMAVDGEVIFEGYYNPYNPDDPYIIHSLTKLFTNTAAGIAVTEGKLKLSDKIVDYFPEQIPADASDNLKAMTAKDLITQRSGHGRMISGNEWRPLKTSWLEAFLKEPVPHKPGEKYQYSSGNTYMLSAMVQKATGLTCEDVLRSSVIPALGIEHFSWDKSPEGICSGGNGVMVTPEDILKIGVLYLQKGVWNGKRLLTEEWCDESLGLKDPLYDGKVKNGYHWEDMDGIISAGGAFGQNLLAIPSLNMTVVFTGGTTQRYLEVYADALRKNVVDKTLADTNRQYDGACAEVLKRRGATLNLLPLATVTCSPVAEKINGKTFAMEDNPDGITAIRLDFTDDSVTYTMVDQRGIHTIVNGVGAWTTGFTTMTGNYLHHQYQNSVQKVVAGAQWQDDNTLTLDWAFTEMAFRDHLVIKLTEDSLSMVRSVNANSSGPFGGMERPEVKGKLE